MAIDTDFSVNATGDIRHVAGTTVYSALQLHAWLQDLADNATSSGDDNVSILSSNPSKIAGPRAGNKPMSVTLLGTFNIDDTAAQFLNFGSIEQNSGNDLYTGVKSIGSPLVASSPMYVVQNDAKITKFWSNGHIQILVKAKTAGTLIAGGAGGSPGDIRVFSRAFGQTYADFAANLTAGSEQPAAISTALDSNIALSFAAASALSSVVTITVGATTLDLGNGNGSRSYSGTIALTGGCTLAQAYQYCMAISSENSAVSIGGIPGWMFRALSTFTPNAAAPFGTLAGGKWFIAQGWKITGVLPAEAQNYQLIDNTGATQIPPNMVGITIGALSVGDTILCGRDNGTDIIQNEYTLNGAHTSGMSTITVTGSIKSDTPSTGVIRVSGTRYSYLSWTGSVFTISGTLGVGYSNGSSAFVPFIDKVATSTSESASFIFGSGFTARVKVRLGSGVTPIKPFETTFAVGSSGGSANAIRDPDV
jgi:hypothetical protein